MDAARIKAILKEKGDPKQAEIYQWFFKTGPGEYAEGDRFIGVRVPVIRSLAKKYLGLSFPELKKLISSKIHEERLFALIQLTLIYPKASEEGKEKIFNFYMENVKHINNWDLVDASCYKIAGPHLMFSDKELLYKLAVSEDLWERRIAIISTFYFIKNNFFEDALNISEILLYDKHDLIHKAVGWMLREIGNRDREVEEEFLEKYAATMPRTALRYAIEKFPEKKRKQYLNYKNRVSV